MMKFLFVSIVVFLFCFTAAGQSKVSVYSNPEFNYSIEYPADVFMLDEGYISTEGARFTSPTTAGVRMMVRARKTAKADVTDDYNAFLTRYGNAVTQKQATKDSFAIRIMANSVVTVVKGLHRNWKGDNTFYLLTIDYPAGLESKFGPAAQQAAASFKLHSGDEK